MSLNVSDPQDRYDCICSVLDLDVLRSAMSGVKNVRFYGHTVRRCGESWYGLKNRFVFYHEVVFSAEKRLHHRNQIHSSKKAVMNVFGQGRLVGNLMVGADRFDGFSLQYRRTTPNKLLVTI